MVKAEKMGFSAGRVDFWISYEEWYLSCRDRVIVEIKQQPRPLPSATEVKAPIGINKPNVTKISGCFDPCGFMYNLIHAIIRDSLVTFF
jgi:hypothetical protein